MDRKPAAHTPLPTEGSIVDPAAEAARKHLSWTPGVPEFGDDDDEVEFDMESREAFVEYVGNPDGSFVVTVHMQRTGTTVQESVVAMGRTQAQIHEAHQQAHEQADRAITALLLLGADQ